MQETFKVPHGVQIAFGPVLMEVRGSGATARTVMSQLATGSVRHAGRSEPDLLLEIGDGFGGLSYQPRWFSAKGKLHFDAGSYYCDYPLYFRYLATGALGAGPIHARIDVSKTSARKRLKSLISRRSDFETHLILSYTLTWYLLHLALLRKGAAFMHGSALATGQGATLIAGTGGCGKTSTLFKALEDGRRRYLGEDFIILDGGGWIHFNPKPVAVYASDIEFNGGILSAYERKLGAAARLSRALERRFLRRNPILRVPPLRLTNGRVAQSEALRHAVYMIRGDFPAFGARPASTEEFCERALDASMRELKTLHELLCLIRANAPLDLRVPSFQSVVDESRRTYLKALRAARPSVVEVPHRMQPDEVVRHLESSGLV
jgi:hypothetical protein